jgi:hypothetical protein
VTPPADGSAHAALTLGVATGAAVGRSVLDVRGLAGSLAAGRRLRLLVHDGIAPEAPRKLTAEARNRRVVLSWRRGREADLAGYRVSRAESTGPFTAIAEVGTAFFKDTQVGNGKAYRYRVTAFDAAGNESSPSAVVSATPRPPAGAL